MTNEKELKAYMDLLERSQDSPVKFVIKEIREMVETTETLWQIARLARKWQKAYPGADSADAEYELSQALEALKG